MAKKILIAQGVLIGAVLVGVAIHEYPGLVREIRMWRMARLHN